jgi:iron complex outermembrane receptor protein
MQGTAQLGPLSLAGAFSTVDSRVRRVAPAYSGDLRVGDRMLEVPARTLALTGAWAADGWSLSLTGTRAFDWINYDRLQLARDFVLRHRDPDDLAGAQLRAYWREHAGSTRLNAVGTMNVRPGVVLVLTADNLLDHQRGEPDNLTLVPGRTLTLGLRAGF